MSGEAKQVSKRTAKWGETAVRSLPAAQQEQGSSVQFPRSAGSTTLTSETAASATKNLLAYVAT